MTDKVNDMITSDKKDGLFERRSLFPWKLWKLLDDVKAEGDESIVSWLPDGKAFRVHKRNQFVKKMLPQFSRQTNYKSFQRQLYLYGFKQETAGQQRGAYFHPRFTRNFSKNLFMIRRIKNGSGKKMNNNSSSIGRIDSYIHSSSMERIDSLIKNGDMGALNSDLMILPTNHCQQHHHTLLQQNFELACLARPTTDNSRLEPFKMSSDHGSQSCRAEAQPANASLTINPFIYAAENEDQHPMSTCESLFENVGTLQRGEPLLKQVPEDLPITTDDLLLEPSNIERLHHSLLHLVTVGKEDVVAHDDDLSPECSNRKISRDWVSTLERYLPTMQ